MPIRIGIVQRTLVTTTAFVTKGFAIKSNLLFIKKLDMVPSNKALIMDSFEQSNQTFCVFV